jgi:hypothetical protein
MGDERGDRRWMSRVELVYTCEVQLHIASSCIAHYNYVSLLFYFKQFFSSLSSQILLLYRSTAA